MFALFGISLLLGFIYVRPQEFVPGLDRIPALYLLVALSAFGAAIDLRLRALRPIGAPTLPWIAALLAWLVLSILATVPTADAQAHLTLVFVSFALYLLVAHCVQSLRAFELVSGVIAALVLMLTAVGIHQGFAPLGCVLLDESDPRDMRSGVFDGRQCEAPVDCTGPDAAPGGEYACEHIGVFGTTSADHRVRYRGVLQDPNELALAISCGLPLLFALASVRRRWRWRLVAILGAAAVLACVVMTRSRSGQLVLLAVLGTYFVRRLGARGLIAVAVLCLPVLLLGGREGAEANMSSDFRLESWRTAIELAREHPLLGVGQGMFVEHHFLTAHNSYLLVAAELGMVGMLLWSIPLYLAVKTPIAVLRTLRNVPEARVARVWALALLASMAGLLTGMLFLSFAYHAVLWIYLGLCGALSVTVRRHRPGWTVDFGIRDFALVVVLDLGFIATSMLFLRLQGY
jgi:O-antigen ligase